LLCGCTPDSAPPADSSPAIDSVPLFTAPILAASESITAEAIREVVAEISADRYAGRGPGSEGDVAARAYLASRLEAAGFRPGAADGSWEQPFGLVGIRADQPSSWGFTDGAGDLVLNQSDDFIVASGVQASVASVSDAEVVFVGYGIQAPEYDWDDYKDADLEGKVLLMLNNDPDWDPELFDGETRLYYGRWTYKYESAARQGAAGAIIIHTTPSAGYPWQVVQTSWTGEQFELPAGDEPRLQVAAWVTEEAARALVDRADLDLDALIAAAREPEFVPVPLQLQTSIELQNSLSQTTTANVIGLLDGSDPGLADEVVVYMAHHDHLGVAEQAPDDDPGGDRIYNGARDNGIGVAVVTAIAGSLAALPERPRRSTLVAFVGAEEQGLLGSKYLAAEPVVPAGRMAALLNFDGGNIWGRTSDISFVGYGKSTLDDVADTVASYQGRTVRPDQYPDRGYYYRSDQFSLAQIGVPGIFLRGGSEFIGRPAGWGEQQLLGYERENYHQPSDELTDDWEFSGLVEDARFGFLAGVLIANGDGLPAWLPGDEFEAARLEALDAL
ncbi:MAG: M28 family peptidase, partial [Gammaproteobacteria bacterium]|nr:M28 family peptidase [Gammaproteobacteria bacterium]